MSKVSTGTEDMATLSADTVHLRAGSAAGEQKSGYEVSRAAAANASAVMASASTSAAPATVRISGFPFISRKIPYVRSGMEKAPPGDGAEGMVGDVEDDTRPFNETKPAILAKSRQ